MRSVLTRIISFGDCDLAGIVFYPNAFRWMDEGFHALLRDLGGHAELCRSMGAVGLGVVDAATQFYRPMREGDQLDLRISVAAELVLLRGLMGARND